MAAARFKRVRRVAAGASHQYSRNAVSHTGDDSQGRTNKITGRQSGITLISAQLPIEDPAEGSIGAALDAQAIHVDAQAVHVDAQDAGVARPPPERRFSSAAAAEEFIAAAWTIGIRGKAPKLDAEYWQLGININRALDIIRELWFNEGLDLPVNMFAEAPTMRRMAAKLCDGSAWVPQTLVQLRAGDASTPLFLFAGGTGLLMEYADFVRQLDYPGPVYGIPLAGMDRRSAYSKTVREEAERAIAVIRRVQPHGPYRLMGYSSGGCNTLEAARALRAAGEEIGFLGLLDTGLTDHYWPFGVWLRYMVPELINSLRKRLLRRKAPAAEPIADRALRNRPNIVPPRRGTRYEFRFRDPRGPDYPHFTPYWRGDLTPLDGETRFHSLRMWGLYEPERYDGHVTFFFAKRANSISCSPRLYWSKYLPDVEWVEVPGDHITMMIARNAARLTAEVTRCIAESDRSPDP